MSGASGTSAGKGSTPKSDPSQAPLIGLENVSIGFDKQLVLQNINLGIKAGQTVAIVGESGCGKTVLLKLIIGLLKPTCGRVTFDGKVLAELPEGERVRQRL